MYDIRDAQDLDRLVTQLRQFRSDHQWVEAKRSRRDLPQTLWTSLSAFANSDEGGIVLLGVHEDGGRFTITGVDDPGDIAQKLQSACAELDPELRAPVHLVDHPDGVVVTTRIDPLSAARWPCHRAGESVYETSYVRVGDANQRMSRADVDDLLAARSGHDDSLRPAPNRAVLDSGAVARLLDTARSRSARLAKADDDEVLRRLQIVDADGQPTLAGFLAVGDAPESKTAAARVSLIRPPEMENARFDASHAEGTIGELLTQTMAWLRRTLPTSQVQTSGGNVVDEMKIPAIALREVLANALLHRSMTEARTDQKVQVRVTDETVSVVSPGVAAPGTDVGDIGVRPLSAPRNPALARIAEYLQTPDGARVAEMVASGIPTADAHCTSRRLLPPLIETTEGTFTVTFDRRRLGEGELLVAAAARLARLRDDGLVGSNLHLDVALAARITQTPPDEAAASLTDLTRRKALRRRQLPGRAIWAPAPPTERDDPKLTLLLATLFDGPRHPKDLEEPLGYSSRKSVLKVISRAIDQGLVREPTGSPSDPTREYELTEAGREAVTEYNP